MYTPLIFKAITFAAMKHHGQLDDEGLPAIMHPIQTANIIRQVTLDENLICAGYLHDTAEDCGVKHEELVSEFNKDVADLVFEVTHEGQKDWQGYYFPRLKTQRGYLLKFADRISNLSRMGSWDKERIAHYMRRSVFWKENVE